MSDTLFDGSCYRVLTIVDCHSRESLAIEPRHSFRAFHVMEALDRIARERGLPKAIRCDNGPEFAGRVLNQWAFYKHVQLDFSRPATPTDNAFIEAFNASVPKELLNASWFATLAEAGSGWLPGGGSTTRIDSTRRRGTGPRREYAEHARAARKLALALA